MLHQPSPPHLQLRSLFRRARQIDQLIRIFLQMEELLRAIQRVIQILPLSIRQPIPVVRRTIGDVVLQVDVLPPALGLEMTLPAASPILEGARISIGMCADCS
jgi:hypothetical protein